MPLLIMILISKYKVMMVANGGAKYKNTCKVAETSYSAHGRGIIPDHYGAMPGENM